MKTLVLLCLAAAATSSCRDAYSDAWRYTYNKGAYGPSVGPAISKMQDEIRAIKAAESKANKP